MKPDSKNILILFFTLVVVMLGFGMVIPILPFYVKHFGAGGSAMGGLMATYAVMQFIFAPVWGSLSDQYGRKPILLIGIAGNALAQILFGLSTELWMLFAARILAGMLSSATLPTAMAYISDSTAHHDRSKGMGILGAAMGIGMVLGPGIAGWLGTYSLSWPFFLAALLSLAAFTLALARLPESLPQAEREQTDRKVRGPQVKEMWRALSSPIGTLLFMAFLLTFGLTNFEAVFGLYANARFASGPGEVGLLLTFVGLVSAVVQGLLTGLATRRWGEVRIVKAALILSAIGFLLMLQANTIPALIPMMGFFILSNAMLNPSVSSLISQRATIKQGMAMGLNNSFQSLGRMTGPLWAGFIFDVDIRLPYLTGAVILLFGFIYALAALKHTHAVSQPVEQIVPPVG
jgi:DHA1 family multidrug resistance protein-like MFS transporter